MTTRLFPYQSIPGAFYRVDACSDPTLVSDDPVAADNPFATAIYADIVSLCPGAPVATYDDYNRRARVMTPKELSTSPPTDQQYVDMLVKRGIAMKYHSVIIRQPHWFFQTP
ncbi:MAG: hypothetical protein H0U85_08255 [Gemmatimonadales bacterium]|nr:hypothetical protein [Gemmatimonadales bacterium]